MLTFPTCPRCGGGHRGTCRAIDKPNTTVDKRAGDTAEASCRSCPAFMAYMPGSAGLARGDIGVCQSLRLEDFIDRARAGQIPCFVKPAALTLPRKKA